MSPIHTQFGIDEVYFHNGLQDDLLEKIYRRAEFSLDGEDSFVLKYSPSDIILVFRQRAASSSLIHRFLKTLDSSPEKENYIKDNTLINEEELFDAIKSKMFVLITKQVLVKEIYIPE